MEELIYREANQSDLPALKRFEQLLIDSERSFDSCIKNSDATYYDMNKLMSDSDSYVLVAEYGDGIIASGYAQIVASKIEFQTHSEYCHIDFVFVEPKFRSKGVAKNIISHLEQWASTRGVDRIHLETYIENEAAIRVYEKLGFKKILVTMEHSL